jgi:hypothetical protein
MTNNILRVAIRDILRRARRQARLEQVLAKTKVFARGK